MSDYVKLKSLHHKFFALLLGMGILALLVSTGALVVNSLSGGSNAGASSSIPRNEAPLNIGSVLASYIAGNGHTKEIRLLLRPYITFLGGNLSPSSNRLTGTLEVILPPGVPPQMRSHGKPMFSCPSGGACTAYPRYANETVDAQIMVSNAGSNFEEHFPIKLKDMFATSTLGLHEFPVDIPVKGSAGQYPQDTYSASVSLFLDFPGSDKFDTGLYRQVQSIESGTLSNAYAVTASVSPHAYQKILSNKLDTFAVSIGRPWYDEFFVYTVALIPVLFALLFLHLLFFAGGGHGIGRSFEHFTEALVVSVLSVLPLRVVLVPGDISGLTRVDLTLAVGLVLIVTVAAGKYVGEIWGGTPTPATQAEMEKEAAQAESARDQGLSEAEANATI